MELGMKKYGVDDESRKLEIDGHYGFETK